MMFINGNNNSVTVTTPKNGDPLSPWLLLVAVLTLFATVAPVFIRH